MSALIKSDHLIGAAHIFCDESGGSDHANTAFLAAAVAIVPDDARQLIRSFHKATKIKGEIKGHRLTPAHRTIFFDLLAKRADVISIVVTCSRLDPSGGWAMGSLPEVELYSHLLAEACVALPDLAIASHLTVTPDGGRYKKVQLDPVRQHITKAVTARHPHARVNFGFGDSATLPGLQVADVIANSAFQSLGTTATAATARSLLKPLISRGSLLIQGVRLDGVRPDWLEKA